jgi:hypothetical protein
MTRFSPAVADSMKRQILITASAVALALGLVGCATQTHESVMSAGQRPTADAVRQTLESWPMTAKHAAAEMLNKYGPPQEATSTRLVWFNNGPWKRTTITREETDHHFPMPHKDVMEQVIEYQIPPEKAAELARFDGSVHVYRTQGEIAARCDMEGANFLALNLANDIVTGKRSVEDARQFYPKALMAHMQKQSSPYTEKLQFAARGDKGFRDQTIVSKDEMQQAMKLKKAIVEKDLQQAGLAGGSERAPATGATR